MQRSPQDVLAEEGDGVERLVLGTGGDVSCEGQLSQESFELLLAGQAGRYALQCANVPAQPIKIGLLGGQCLVLPPDHLPRPLDGFLCVHNTLSGSGSGSC